MPLELDPLPARTTVLLTERAFAALTTIRPDGRPHTAVVGFVYDADAHECWLILRGSGVKHANLTAAGGEQSVTLCQSGEGGRWITFEGKLRLVPGREALAETLRRYRTRYGDQIADDPSRVAAVLSVTKAYGTG